MIFVPVYLPSSYSRPMHHRFMVRVDYLKTGQYEDWKSFRTLLFARAEQKFWTKTFRCDSIVVDTKEEDR